MEQKEYLLSALTDINPFVDSCKSHLNSKRKNLGNVISESISKNIHVMNKGEQPKIFYNDLYSNIERLIDSMLPKIIVELLGWVEYKLRLEQLQAVTTKTAFVADNPPPRSEASILLNE